MHDLLILFVAEYKP